MDPDSFRRTSHITIFSHLAMALALLCTTVIPWSCTHRVEHTAEAVDDKDSLPFMHSIGISTLVSDSGRIRYHMVAEEWDIYMNDGKQPTWKFCKGLLMLRLDDKFHVDLYVQADTAYLHEQRLWELRGRVRVRNIEGTVFNTDMLYWDLMEHEIWNHCPMEIITPGRTLHGTEFRSNEDMTRYNVKNSVGDFPASDADGTGEEAIQETEDSATQEQRSRLLPPDPGKQKIMNNR